MKVGLSEATFGQPFFAGSGREKFSVSSHGILNLTHKNRNNPGGAGGGGGKKSFAIAEMYA